MDIPCKLHLGFAFFVLTLDIFVECNGLTDIQSVLQIDGLNSVHDSLCLGSFECFDKTNELKKKNPIIILIIIIILILISYMN